MKNIIFLSLLFVGCTQNVKQEDIQALNAHIVKLNARLDGIDKELYDISDYLNKRHVAVQNRKHQRQEFEKSVNSRLDLLETRVHNLMPIYQQK